MKILQVFKSKEIEEYRLHEKAKTHPQDFVKDIVYRDGNYTVIFSEDGSVFKTFTGFPVEYREFGEMKTKSQKDKLQ